MLDTLPTPVDMSRLDNPGQSVNQIHLPAPITIEGQSTERPDFAELFESANVADIDVVPPTDILNGLDEDRYIGPESKSLMPPKTDLEDTAGMSPRESDSKVEVDYSAMSEEDFIANIEVMTSDEMLQNPQILDRIVSQYSQRALEYRTGNDLELRKNKLFASPELTQALFDKIHVDLNALEVAKNGPASPAEMLALESTKLAFRLNLQSHNFGPEEIDVMLHSWAQIDDIQDNREYAEYMMNKVITSVETINQLEYEVPGLAGKLFRERGIVNFARYDKETLKNQFETIDPDQPITYLLTSRDDHNGAFYYGADVIMAKNLPNLRIGEIGSVSELVGVISNIYNTDGALPVTNLILGGHGAKEGVDLGHQDNPQKITNEVFHALEGDEAVALFSQVKNMLHPEDGRLLMMTCSTGIEGGIGQAAAKQLDPSLTLAPMGDSIINDIEIDENGRINNASFKEDSGAKESVEVARYERGQRFSQQRRIF